MPGWMRWPLHSDSPRDAHLRFPHKLFFYLLTSSPSLLIPSHGSRVGTTVSWQQKTSYYRTETCGLRHVPAKPFRGFSVFQMMCRDEDLDLCLIIQLNIYQKRWSHITEYCCFKWIQQPFQSGLNRMETSLFHHRKNLTTRFLLLNQRCIYISEEFWYKFDSVFALSANWFDSNREKGKTAPL